MTGSASAGRAGLIAVSHTYAEGTLVTGTQRGDGSATILKAQRLRWSSKLGVWYVPRSRDKPSNHVAAIAQALRGAGFQVAEVVDPDDTPRSVAEREAGRIARSEDRADGLAHKAGRLEGSADAAYERSRAVTEHIPFGQPVLVGHHSERRHRRDLKRADDAMRRSVEASRAAAEASRGSSAARARAAERRNAVFVGRRIDQYTRELAAARRSGREHLIREAAEQLDYWTGLQVQLVEEGDAVVWSRTELALGDLVLIRGRWSEVARLSPKTVAVLCGMPWPLKYIYTEIVAARSPLRS